MSDKEIKQLDENIYGKHISNSVSPLKGLAQKTSTSGFSEKKPGFSDKKAFSQIINEAKE